MSFQIAALDPERFSHLFGRDDQALARSDARRVIADSDFGYPCRVSLRDAELGESLLLVNYEHQPACSPYRSSHAIFVRERAKQAKPAENEVPEVLSKRLLSVRAFDSAGMMLDAHVVDGRELRSLIEPMFENNDVDYLHVHNAAPGCYAASVRRA